MCTHRSAISRPRVRHAWIDRETGLVLVVGWLVALAVTLT